ncbi:hypothetical protein [[Limnothrix rosea] IAM M-220]|uniref:hypothetical protein n=1 Tax=[Limnothrix rosea] IAM M-220 TaxID=454133 RepID=UPI000966321A|nr:hypothetical protein [[Limnothrix rosea] IAM M-220]OKH16056.1 hypothetical protein NIES208_11860 [[Limnothrix rosea] IAM M-220]
MTNNNPAPIGELLTSAGLISEGQLQTALYDQQVYQDMRFGDILATRGWLSKQTVDFFCNVFQNGAPMHNKRPLLGECLAEAALIDEEQIQQILEEQRVNHLRFGSLAVLKGYISQRTLDFFLKHTGSGSTSSDHYFQGSSQLDAAKKTLAQNYRQTTPQEQTLTAKDTLGSSTQPQYQTAPSQQPKQEVEINWI